MCNNLSIQSSDLTQKDHEKNLMNHVVPNVDMNPNWLLLEQDERAVLTLCQKFSLDNIVSRILINRGVDSIVKTENFINGKLRDTLPDPFLFKDMDKASERMIKAIINQEVITIFADYDVDGATSAAVFHNFFKLLGIQVKIYVPNRLSEGYGPNLKAMETIKANGTSLIITVDCGSTAHEPLQKAYDLGMDVIVVDHHIAPANLPKAFAIVNPNRLDDEFPYKSIAAVTVSFFCLIAIRKKLRDLDWFNKNNIDEPDLMNFLDLVALGTVCDVMPLTDMNRIFVKQGLKIIKQRRNIGIATLLDIAKIQEQPQAYHLGYVIGPRINAGGRVDESHLGSYLLISENTSEAFQIAMKLESLNEERKQIENQMVTEALEHIEKNNIDQQPMIIAYGYNWHIGVLGILASRIKEKYNKPAAVISVMGDIGKGSARSVTGINIGEIISSAKVLGIIKEGGGHAMAGGFSLDADKIDEFSKYINNHLNNKNNIEELIVQASRIPIDAAISVKAINKDLMRSLEILEPFGNANHTPRFVIYEAKIIKAYTCGKDHISFSIVDHELNAYHDKSKILQCIWFRGMSKDSGKKLIQSQGMKVDIVGSLKRNHVFSDSIQLIVEDAYIKE